MKELVIISGKGGTGKTSVTASLAFLAKGSVMADCDVDAADLHLILLPKVKECSSFRSGLLASINAEKCIGCGACKEACRFDAICEDNSLFEVDALACEGCKVCRLVCPADAVSIAESECGEWFVSETRCGTMVHAALRPGSENSGRLVSLVRQKAREVASSEGSPLIIIDGPPGIGCPVIASVGGTSMALVVTEPTQSGIHDLKRVLELNRHFKIPSCVCINKWDINPVLSRDIEVFCEQADVGLAGKIPYDESMTKAMIAGVSAVEYSDNFVSEEIRKMWVYLQSTIQKEKNI